MHKNIAASAQTQEIKVLTSILPESMLLVLSVLRACLFRVSIDSFNPCLTRGLLLQDGYWQPTNAGTLYAKVNDGGAHLGVSCCSRNSSE